MPHFNSGLESSLVKTAESQKQSWPVCVIHPDRCHHILSVSNCTCKNDPWGFRKWQERHWQRQGSTGWEWERFVFTELPGSLTALKYLHQTALTHTHLHSTGLHAPAWGTVVWNCVQIEWMSWLDLMSLLSSSQPIARPTPALSRCSSLPLSALH